MLDLYPYATTSPAWLDQVIAAAEARNDYGTAAERQAMLDYLRKARDRYSLLGSSR